MNKPCPHTKYSLPGLFFLLLFSAFAPVKLSSQVEARVDYLRQGQDTVETINVRWTLKDEINWHIENDGRLDVMGLRCGIISNELPKTSLLSSAYHFDFPGSASIELRFENVIIAEGEQLFLWNHETRKIIFDFKDHTTDRILSPAFDPATTELIWKCNTVPLYASHFTIENIYYQQMGSDGSRGIGFGTALPCHPNAACKQDSLMKLISNCAVRIKLVMEEGIGWCTGSFVNNTRNDKTPYLLTAYHCQFDYTPLYDMWRFDFQFKSDSCPNPPVEPQIFSLTGCTLKSSGQASDFLFLLLDDPIPVDEAVTFAGWDHDEMAIPDTSYCIHHPNADIRKFSTDVNTAVIHPNQIGWSEGYTTPANHHFRLKFTEGGHEPGSSGAPLFNQDGYLVGQLHGGTAGCETTNSVFVGRFAKSWNLGTTPEGRLKDWLDPDNTGLVRIPSIENVSAEDIVDMHGLVVDPQGRPVSNTKINITGAVQETLTTDENGVFDISGINRNGQYNITPEKTTNPTNGVNALDLVAIQKHLLGKDTFDFPWQLIAADATNNDDLAVGDIVLLLRLLLGKIMVLPSNSSWNFDPPQVVINSLPPGEPAEIHFTAIKIGDVNGTADPKL